MTPAFTVGQTLDASSFTLTDTSTSVDGAITQRRIYIQLANGTYLVPTGTTTDYVDFPLSDGASITIDGVLNIDYAVSITLQWLSVTDVVLYSLPQSFAFVLNDEQFMYFLVQCMGANRNLINTNNFIFTCFELDMYVSYAQKAVTTGDDIALSQFMLAQAQKIVDNKSTFF